MGGAIHRARSDAIHLLPLTFIAVPFIRSGQMKLAGRLVVNPASLVLLAVVVVGVALADAR